MYSHATRTLLHRLGLRDDEEDRGLEPPKAAGPTIVLVEDPHRDAQTVSDSLDEFLLGPKPNRWLQRYSKRGLQRTEEGPVIEGRRCCVQLALRLNRRLHVLRLPSTHTCECGAVWRVEMRVREERRHG